MRHAARSWLVRLIGSLRPSETANRELADELASHLQLHADANIRRGMTVDDARRHARLALYGVESTKDAYRDRKGFPMIDALVRDARYGVRTLTKAPAFSLAAVVILALGIGANTAMFSVVNAVILRPLPLADSSRIMRVWHTPPAEQFAGRTTFAVSPANYLDWRAQNHVFERMAIYTFRRLNLTGSGAPEALATALVSADFFNVLGVQPMLGRTFVTGDDEPGAPNIVIISEGMWRSRFAADPAMVGRSILLDSQPHTIVGIVHQLPLRTRTEIWIPLVWTEKDRAVRGNHNHVVIARLKPHVEVQQAQAEMATISRRLEQQYPADDKGWGALVLPLHDDMVGDVRTPLLVLLGAVAFVLLIACANLANLLLARGLARGKEFAVRAALGASRARIVQQLLVETVLLAAGGAIVGLAAARLGVTAIVQAIGQALPRAGEIGVDGRVLAFTSAIAVCTGLLAGVMPAWKSTRSDFNETLKQGLGRAGSEHGERRVRHLLVVSEVALAMLLLVGAGLLIRSLEQLRGVDPGIDPRNVLTMTIAIPPTKYPQPDQQTQFFDRVLQRVRALPGVVSAGTIDSLPLQGGSTQPVAIEGQPVPPLSEQPEVAVCRIAPGYLATVRMRLLAGRDFTDADRLDRPASVLVSQSMARRFWPDANPIGRHVTLGLISDTPREVVGIVNDVKLAGLDMPDPVAAVYVPHAQVPGPFRSFVVRTTLPPESAAQSVTGALHQVDPDQPVQDVITMDEVIGASLTQRRVMVWLLTTFAGLALVLAAAGIYSVLSYTVRQRVREIGIRMALGAQPSGVLRMIVVEGMTPTLIGLAIGVVSATALGHVLTTLVFGVTAHDGTTFIVVSILVILVGLIASAVPGYRATRVDPLQALRTE
jgi:putative ABC transport system permease protein